MKQQVSVRAVGVPVEIPTFTHLEVYTLVSSKARWFTPANNIVRCEC